MEISTGVSQLYQNSFYKIDPWLLRLESSTWTPDRVTQDYDLTAKIAATLRKQGNSKSSKSQSQSGEVSKEQEEGDSGLNRPSSNTSWKRQKQEEETRKPASNQHPASNRDRWPCSQTVACRPREGGISIMIFRKCWKRLKRLNRIRCQSGGDSDPNGVSTE